MDIFWELNLVKITTVTFNVNLVIVMFTNEFKPGHGVRKRYLPILITLQIT